MLLALEERLGGGIGEVAVDVLPFLFPAGDGVLGQLAEQMPLITKLCLHELTAGPFLHELVQSGFGAVIAIFPVFLWAKPLPVIAIDDELVGVVHVQAVNDLAVLDLEQRGAGAVVRDPWADAVIAQALDEVGPSRGVEAVAGCQARCRLSDFVFCGHEDTSRL